MKKEKLLDFKDPDTGENLGCPGLVIFVGLFVATIITAIALILVISAS